VSAVITLFKVADFGTNQKPVCDFLIVNNTDILSCTVKTEYLSNFRFRQGEVPLFHALILGNFCEYHHCSYIAEIYTVNNKNVIFYF